MFRMHTIVPSALYIINPAWVAAIQERTYSTLRHLMYHRWQTKAVVETYQNNN